MERKCFNCKYYDSDKNGKPCVDCYDYANWELLDDVVNHPDHYCQEGAMECIDEMVAVFGYQVVADFCLCNVWKYRKRALFKNGMEDMNKSDKYMKWYVQLKETGGVHE